MADPPSLTSSESEEETVEQFSNTFDDEDIDKTEMLHVSPSDSESESESKPYTSLYSVFKPGHIPGSGSIEPVPLDLKSVIVADDANKNEKAVDKEDLSLEQVDEQKDEHEPVVDTDTLEEPGNQTKQEQKSVEAAAITLTDEMHQSAADSLHQHKERALVKPPSPPKPVLLKIVTDDRTLRRDSKIEDKVEAAAITLTDEMHQSAADSLHQHKERALVKPPPPPKPVLPKIVTDDRTLRRDSKIEDKEISEKHSSTDDALCEEIGITNGRNSTTGDLQDTNETMKEYEAETAFEHGKHIMEGQKDVIITDSMVADLQEDNDNEFCFHTSLTGNDSFEVLEISDDDKDEYDTANEADSDDEGDRMIETVANINIERNRETESEETDIKETSIGSSNKFSKSFVVIGSGSFSELRHGYKSISSSVSEGDLHTSDDLRRAKDDTDEHNPDNRNSVRDKMKFFEEFQERQSQEKTKTKVRGEEINVNTIEIKTENFGNYSYGGQSDWFEKDERTEMEELRQETIQIDSEQEANDEALVEDEHTRGKKIKEDKSDSGESKNAVIEDKETLQRLSKEEEKNNRSPVSSGEDGISSTKSSEEAESSFIRCESAVGDNVDILPAVPPKSLNVLRELESIRSLQQEDSLEQQRAHDPSTEMSDSGQMSSNVHTDTGFNSNQHETNQAQTKQDQFSSYTTGSSASVPLYTGSPSEYYLPYPIYYDPERMKTDPDYAQYMYYQNYYQQQLLYSCQMAQGHSLDQNVHSSVDLGTSSNEQDQVYSRVVSDHAASAFANDHFPTQDGTSQIVSSHIDQTPQDERPHIAERDGPKSETKDKAHVKHEIERPSMVNKYDKRNKEQTEHTNPLSTENATKAKQEDSEALLRAKHRAPPVPKPRRSVVLKQTEHRSLPHTDKNRAQPKKTGISHPRKIAERKSAERKSTGILSSEKGFERKTNKSSGVLQIPKSHPVTSEASQDIQENPKEDVFVYIKNISETSSTENLENFLEGGAGNDAEVKENTTIYSRAHTEALVTFAGKPDMTELNKRCSQRTLDGNYLKICEVPAPTCIAVSSEDDIQSTETLMYYFELPKNHGGELAADEVVEAEDGSCNIIQFKSPEVVKNICSREHEVVNAKLRVSPYYKCEIGEIWDSNLHYIPLPEPVTIHLSETFVQFLSRQCCQKLKQDLSNKYADIEYSNNVVTLKCLLTQRTPNCRSLTRKWTSDVRKTVDTFLTQLCEKTLHVDNHVWEGMTEFLETGELEKDTLLIELMKEKCQISLYGMMAEVEEAYDQLISVQKEVDRRVRRTMESICLNPPARSRLLQLTGVLTDIEKKSVDLKLELEGATISFEGVPEDIRDAILRVHEANSEIVSEKVRHDFSSALVDFVNQVERKNSVTHTVKKLFKENNLIGEFEITTNDCLILVPPENQCRSIAEIILDKVSEEKISYEKESAPLLKEQLWEEVIEDLTERYEDTADVIVNEIDRVVHIVGLKEFVLKATDQVERFFEENTIKMDRYPWDQLTQKFIMKYRRKEVKKLESRLSESQVSIKLQEKEVLIQSTRKGLQAVKQELVQMFSKICHKTHTFESVGVIEAMNNISVQLDEIETKTECVIDRPTMLDTIYSTDDQHTSESGARWQGTGDEDLLEKPSSSVDEPPGLKAKNGLKVTLVKGEIGKQEGSVIVCATSPDLNLVSGAAGKSLLREGGHSLHDECKEIIANRDKIEHGEIVKIRGGNIECKYIFLTSLPLWKEESMPLQILEDIVRDCLIEASKENSVSILFCALGTGGMKYPAEEVAAVMYSKVLEFDSANPDTSLKDVKFVLYQKDTTTISAFEEEERRLRRGAETITYDMKFQNTSVALVVETLATQKVDCILCTTNKDMNLKASGACNALLAAGGQALQDECKNKHGNNLPEGQVAEVAGGKMKCKSVFLTSLPPYGEGTEQTLKSVVQTTLKLAQAKKYKSIACIALGTGYLKYPRPTAAKCMYAAVEEFVTANPNTCLQQIKFVMHAKDRKTIEAFRTYVRRNKLTVTTNRKDRKLDAGKPGSNSENYYNVFHDGCQIRHMQLKVVAGDILEQNTDGIVNSVSDDFKFEGGVASALKSRCPGIEKEGQRKVFKLRSEGVATTKCSKHDKALYGKLIIHVAFQKSLSIWKSRLNKILEKAEEKKLKSLSIPVLGTGSGTHSFKPEDITGCLYEAIDDFSGTPKHSILREVRLVVFHRQKFMMNPILKCLHQKTQAAVMDVHKKASGWGSRLKGFVAGIVKWTGNGQDTTYRQNIGEVIASIKDQSSSINLKIYSDDMSNIDKCIDEIKQALEQEYTDYTLNDYKELIKILTKKEMEKLEQIECVVDMKIDQAAGIIRIKGPKKFVLDAQTELHKCLKAFERSRQQREEAETLYQQIQWQYEEVTTDGIELVPYDEMTNLKIENAYKNKQLCIELRDFSNNTVYVVDFQSLEEYEKDDKANTATVVVRKDILKSAKLPLPAEWTAMKEDENIRITNLPATDPAYKALENRFKTEVTSGQYNNRISSMKNVKVTKIDRIQNKALFQQYAAKKELMTKQTPNPPVQFPIERTVWHGTSQAAVSSIQIHGFNRSYAGDKNGVPWFGNGVYFAADASYSARSWLSGANASGDGTTKGYIFLVKALTGEYCKGQKGMRFLPPKNPSNSTILYDCAVDDEQNPMEFVIFHDAQAYPEYLITFIS